MKRLMLAAGMVSILASVALGQKRIILPNQIGTAPTQPNLGSGRVIYPQNPVTSGGYGQATSQGTYPVGGVPVQMNPSPSKGGNNNQPLVLPIFLPIFGPGINPGFPGINPVPQPIKFGVGGGAGGLNGMSGGY